MAKHCIGILFIIMTVANCIGKSDSNTPQIANKSISENADRDYLVGWYKMGRRLIPVLKNEGGYYSVCRGVEVPLKQCPDGLEWGLTKSSMKGTTIGFDEAAKSYYIIIKDSMRASVEEETLESIRINGFEMGKKTPATKIDKPERLLDANASPPKTIDDFLGVYQPVWFPYVRFEIKKEGDKYFGQELNLRPNDPNGWAKRGKPREMTPLSDKLGFTGLDIIYNQTLNRFEIIMKGDGKEQPATLRMPLVRNPASSPDSNTGLQKTVIGIPSWH
jgi:hypothetical protein